MDYLFFRITVLVNHRGNVHRDSHRLVTEPQRGVLIGLRPEQSREPEAECNRDPETGPRHHGDRRAAEARTSDPE